MSVIDGYNLTNNVMIATKLIDEIGGYAPEKEAKELFDFAVNNAVERVNNRHFETLLERRLNHEPTAYITNHCEFRGLDLYIDNRVLIPRSETEPLVEIAIEELSKEEKVLDVGTGSGAVALAIKNERPDLDVTGVDISKDALDVASINSSNLELKVEWRATDLIEGVKDEYQCVLANLPYLPTIKKDAYQPEMTEHEPQVALWGGEDGFDLTRRLLALVQRRKMVRLLALEIGLGQEVDVIRMVREAGFPIVFCTTDSKDDIRCVVGKRNA